MGAVAPLFLTSMRWHSPFSLQESKAVEQAKASESRRAGRAGGPRGARP